MQIVSGLTSAFIFISEVGYFVCENVLDAYLEEVWGACAYVALSKLFNSFW